MSDPKNPKDETSRSLLSAKDRQMVDDALAIERESALEAGAIAFQARVWAQLALPYRDPGAVSRWERRNGNEILIVRPATLVDSSGETYDGYPFGVLPRYFMTWMVTEAVRTKSPHLDLGPSFRGFLGKLDLDKGGSNSRRIKDQMHRLLGSTVQHQRVERDGQGHRVRGQNFNIAASYELWVPDHESVSEEQPALWNNSITLSPQFYDSLAEGAIPVDLRALRALAGSPMRLDIYTWLTYRMSYLRSPTFIPWAVLELQFGSQASRTRRFKQTFIENLAAVTLVYPEARVVVEDKGLKLYPSPPHIARRNALRSIK